MSAINVNSITGRTGTHGPVLTGVTTATNGLNVGSGTSISSPATNILALGTNSVERLRIDSSGRTTAGGESATASGPQYSRLQVLGNTYAETTGLFSLRRNEVFGDITAGEDLGVIHFADRTGNTFAEIHGTCDGTTGSNDYPGRLAFHITADGASSATERLRIDSNGSIATNGRAPSSYNNPSFLISGDNATLTMMGDGSTNNSSIAAIKFRIAGTSTGDYTKAAIFAKRISGYNDLNMIFALDNAADANGVNLGNEKMRLTSDGLTFNGDTAAANALDDYEEGTWTPSLLFGGGATGMVLTMREGHYVKIGRQVIAQFRLQLTNKGTSTGGMTVSTPLAVLNTFSSTGIDGNILVAYTSGMNQAQVGSAPVSGYVEGGTSLSYFTARLSTGDAATLNNGDVDNDFSVSGTMFFYAA